MLLRLTLLLAGLTASAEAGDQANLLANGDLETADKQHADMPAGFKPGRIGGHYAEMTWASPGYKSKRCVAVVTKDASSVPTT